jgi:hypothetical protein
MIPLDDRQPYPAPGECPYGCEPQVQVSDAWVFAEAVMSLLVSLFTMGYVILSRPRLVLMLVVVVSVLGAIAGWW